MFKNISLRVRLITAFALIAVMSAVAGYVGIATSQRINTSFQYVTKEKTPLLNALLEMKSSISEIESQIIGVTLVEEDAPAEFSAVQKNEFLANIEILEKWLAQFKKYQILHETDDREFLVDFERSKDELVSTALELLSLIERRAETPELIAKKQALELSQEKLEKMINSQVEIELVEFEEELEHTEALIARGIQSNMAILAGAFILAITLGFVISYFITGDLAELKEIVSRLANGELTMRSKSKNRDEIGQLAQAINIMGDHLEISHKALEAKSVQLGELVVQVQSKNTILEENKKAMVNLLEDARDAEENLKIEKEGVERKVREQTQQLREEGARLTASINSLSRAFIVTDVNGKILLHNHLLSNILGQKENEWTLYGMQQILGKAIDVTGSYQKSLREKVIIENKDILFKNRYLKFYFAPIISRTVNEEVIGVVITIADITEDKLLERSKDEFFSIASHELRTPLTAIRGNTSLIQEFYSDKLQDRELKEMIEDIHQSSVRLIGIVNDFLNTSRLELKKMEFKKEEFEIVPLVKDVVKEYATTGSMKKLYINVEQPKHPLPHVIADKDRIKQVLINLIGNGIKFTEQGGITIRFTVGTNHVKVMVADTGKGISKESRALLFRKFQQATENLFTRDAIHGTGLGLYISKMMVEGMGGTIKLESSEIGKGTVFAFFLPIKL